MMRMFLRRHFHWLRAILLAAVAMTAVPFARAQTASFPVTLELLAPTSGVDQVPTVTWGGWPLILRISANNEIGIDVGDLVLLADVGAGYGGLNLADRFKTIGYEFDDIKHRRSVVVSMVVGNGLVTPTIVTDLCVEPTSEDPCPILGRIGGEILPGNALLDLLNQNNVTTLRAFVVNQAAPSQLSDLDGDGLIAARDSELAGFRLLSREVVFRVRTHHEKAEFFFVPPADLDGNNGLCGNCSPGGGGLKPVPR